MIFCGTSSLLIKLPHMSLTRHDSSFVSGVSVILGQEGEAALAIAHAELAALTAELRQLTVERGKDVDLIYMNYADPSQNPLGSYGADNVAFIEAVAKEYDSEGFWEQRTPGGFKISRVVGQK